MIDRKEGRFLNALAQNIYPICEGKDWFEKLSFEKQIEVLREVTVYALQAGAKDSDVQDAITKSGLKVANTC